MEFKDIHGLYGNYELKVYSEEMGVCNWVGVHPTLKGKPLEHNPVMVLYKIEGGTGFMAPIHLKWEEFKPILLPLSAMTKKQARELMADYVYEANKYLPIEDKIDDDEIQFDVHPNDGGLMLDGDITICIEISVRCSIMFFCINENGAMYFQDEDGVILPVSNAATKLVYLLENHFDLFGLIENGQAIDATTLPVNPYK